MSWLMFEAGAIILIVLIILTHRRFLHFVSTPERGVWVDIILGTALLAIIPFALAAYGGHIAAETLSDPMRQRIVKVKFWSLCVVGIVFAFLQQYRSITNEAVNRGKTEGVEAHIVTLLEDLHHPGTMTEAERRKEILQVLHDRYIIDHEVSQRVIDGLDPPPSDWVNDQLKTMGEHWVVSEDNSIPLPSTLNPRSYIIYTGNPIFTGSSVPGVEGSDFQPGDGLEFNVHYKATGPNPVKLLDSTRITLVEPDYSHKSQDEAIDSFTKVVNSKLQSARKNKKDIRDTSHTLMSGDNEFFTAYTVYGTIQEMLKPSLTQEDLDKLHAGSEIAIVISVMTYKDGNTIHHLRRCSWLQPPAKPPGTWAYCYRFPDSD
jgi:hypothetical protein